MGRRGKREFVQVLRLMEMFGPDDVHVARPGLYQLGSPSFDAVRHLVPCGIAGRPPKLDLALYPYLPRVSVSTMSATDCMTLLSGFLREYDRMAAQCAAEGVDYPDYLLRLSKLELIDRHHRMVEKQTKAARFPTVKSLYTFDFLAIPSVNG